MPKRVDWLSLASEYRTGGQSLRGMATVFGTSEGTIRRKAKQYGWVRDGSVEERKIHPTEAANRSVKRVKTPDELAVEDLKDMELGLENARLALRIVNQALKSVEKDEDAIRMFMMDARNLKVLTETNRHNTEVVRRIRGLDEQRPDEVVNLSELDEAILERYVNAKAS